MRGYKFSIACFFIVLYFTSRIFYFFLVSCGFCNSLLIHAERVRQCPLLELLPPSP